METWDQERARFLRELQLRDKLLQSADGHLEAEIEKLRIDLEKAHEDHLADELLNIQEKYEDQLRQTQETGMAEKQSLLEVCYP